jgi:hypothetical protein
MEKLTLFDLLSFAIPGSMALYLTYWGIQYSIPFQVKGTVMPDAIMAIILVMLAYLAGHLVNELAMWLEGKIGRLPKSWIPALNSNPHLAQKLNQISQKAFDIQFLTDDGQIKEAESGLFYDYAFNALEMSGKLDKVRTLQAQYTFLRNTVALSAWGFLIFGMVLTIQIMNGQSWMTTIPMACCLGMAGCLILGWLTRRMSIKRRRFKMKATLEGFYALYVVEHQLKI